MLLDELYATEAKGARRHGRLDAQRDSAARRGRGTHGGFHGWGDFQHSLKFGFTVKSVPVSILFGRRPVARPNDAKTRQIYCAVNIAKTVNIGSAPPGAQDGAGGPLRLGGM